MRVFSLTIWFLILCLSIGMAQNKNNPYPEFKPISQLSNAHISDCKLEKDDSGSFASTFQKLLVFTHPELERYMQGKDLLEVYASVTQGGGQYFIDMRYIFNTVKGIENYGSHSKGAPVKVLLLNKETLYFKNIKSSRTKIKEKEGISMMTASYMLDEYEVKQLLKSPIMEMEVTYLYGTESYLVQNLSLIGDQIRCLKNNK